MHISTKVLDFSPIVFDQSWVRSLVLRNELWYVINLRVVELTGSNFTESKWLVSIVSTILQICAVLQLLLGVQVEEFLANGKLTVDLLLT